MAVAKAAEVLGLLSSRREQPVCVLVHGADRGAVFDLSKAVAAKLLGGAGEENIVRLPDAQKDRLYTEVFSLSMFGGRQAVWLSASGDGVLPELNRVLASPLKGHPTIIDCDALPKTSKLRKACEASPKVVAVALYPATAHELRMRIAARVSAAGASIAEEALSHLTEIVSREVSMGSSEVDKLLTYAGSRKAIGVDDVRAVCGDSYEASLDDVLDAAFEGRMADADRFAAVLDASAGKIILISAMNHVAKLQALAALVAMGQSPDIVVKAPASGVFFRRQPSLARQLRLWPQELLLEAEEKIAAGILQARQRRELEAAISSRTLLAVSWLARS